VTLDNFPTKDAKKRSITLGEHPTFTNRLDTFPSKAKEDGVFDGQVSTILNGGRRGFVMTNLWPFVC